MRMGSIALVIATSVVILGAGIFGSQGPNAQTAFLESVATQLEQVQQIAPETEAAIRQMLTRIHRAGIRLDEGLQTRQSTAIGRIEAALPTVNVSARAKAPSEQQASQ